MRGIGEARGIPWHPRLVTWAAQASAGCTWAEEAGTSGEAATAPPAGATGQGRPKGKQHLLCREVPVMAILKEFRAMAGPTGRLTTQLNEADCVVFVEGRGFGRVSSHL